jgi:hypothetical protein
MDSLIWDIRQALSNNLFYAAIMLCLGIPDMCAVLESPDGSTKPEDYKRWFREWFQPQYPGLSEDDMYLVYPTKESFLRSQMKND